MAVTNIALIAMEEMRLIEEGLMNADESIHTYSHWQSLGFQVKKGEKAITKIAIWNYGGKKVINEETGKSEIKNPHCYGKTAAFFKTSQVELIG